ncbi:MAG: TIGR00282 family metallophosphoesterase [Patescibacteria group bacterium]
MKILFIGDIVGSLGRRTIANLLPTIKKGDNISLCIANSDNIAGGRGVTTATLRELLNCGVDFFTSGDHIFGIKGFENEINNLPFIIKPANFTADSPGNEYGILDLGKLGRFGIVSLLGRTFIETNRNSECPFKAMDRVLAKLEKEKLNGIFVDFHAEATSEKVAMAYYLDGRVSVLVGTHTHIPTADNRIMPGGTAFVSDLGMVGALDSVLGVQKEIILNNFVSSLQKKFVWMDEGPAIFNSVIVDYHEKTGKVRNIERKDRILEGGE